MSDQPASELITSPISTAPSITPVMGGDMVVVAEHPGQLQAAQQALVDWFSNKVRSLNGELTDAMKSLSDARINGWSVKPFQTVCNKLEKEVAYYKKCKAAACEGYCIVPDFPVDIVAVRTDREFPAAPIVSAKYFQPTINEPAQKLPEGVGEYVASETTVELWNVDKNEKGEVVEKWWNAVEFKDVSLPVRFMKPRVLEATQRAMQLKVFDEIGILPARKKSDPIVVGRILGPKKNLSFLIAWFIDTRDL